MPEVGLGPFAWAEEEETEAATGPRRLAPPAAVGDTDLLIIPLGPSSRSAAAAAAEALCLPPPPTGAGAVVGSSEREAPRAALRGSPLGEAESLTGAAAAATATIGGGSQAEASWRC